jgi:hypothetical protein
MRRQCPDCKTVTGGHAGYCGACGYRFLRPDPLRSYKAKTDHAIAVLVGLGVVTLNYLLFH